jgi:nitrite reductase (NADH) small subunit
MGISYIDMPNWVRVASLRDCPAGEGRELVVGGRIIALFNVDGCLHALDGVCPHQGGPLGKGQLQGCVVTCPWHGWQFDVRTGQHQVNRALRHATFPARVDGDDIYVDLDG